MKKVVVITQKGFECCNLGGPLRRTARKNKLDIKIELILIEDIIISSERNGLSIEYHGEDVLNFDAFIFRLKTDEKNEKAILLAREIFSKGKLLINESLAFGDFDNKLNFLEIVRKEKLNHPKTFYIDNKKLIENISKKVGFPLVAKDPFGWQGNYVKKIENEQQLNKLKNSFPKKGLILQEFIPIKNDVRVLVVGYKALGAIKRTAPPGDFRSNISIGGSGEKIALTPEMKKVSEKLSRETKNSVLGVDFLEFRKELYVLEINSTPGFSGFKKYSGIDPSKKLLKHIIEQ